MENRFVHLHVHSEYSLQDSTVRLKPLIEQTRARDMGAVALTDLNNLFAVVKHYKTAIAMGVKPIFGATASGLSLVRRDGEASIDRAAGHLGFPGLVQAVVPEIKTLGETSLIYFAGAFSHAVTKTPQPGSILSQPDFGGRVEAVAPPARAIEAARRLLDLLPEPAHYARVDVVILDDGLRLMEVELIEPELFLTHDDDAAGRLAELLMQELDA